MKIKKLLIIVLLTFPLAVNAGFDITDLSWAKDVGARSEPQGKERFNVTSFGAVADGITMNTKAIQAAIDACSKTGGGIVTFDPGSYLTGSVYLKEGVHLIIPEGVTLLGSQQIEDYPDIPTRVAGIEMVWPSALINVIGEKNVMISGKGEIDGQGKPFWDNYWEMRRAYEAKGLRWIVDYDCKRPRTLLVSGAEDVTVKDVTFKRAGFWTIHLLYSSYSTVDGVIVRNNIGGHGPSTDGIDIDSSSHILVENCDIDCNDDNFCLKAGRDADGLRVNRPTEYVVIRNCISRAGGGLFTCGSETSGGIRYVLAHDLRAKGTSVGLRFKSAMNRGGTTEHIYLKNIIMEEVGTAIEATMNWNPAYSYSALPKEYEGKELPLHWMKMLETVDPAELGIPRFNNIHFSGITVHKARTALKVEGSEQSKMKHFSLNDITINAGSAGSVNHAENWQMDQIDITSEDNLFVQVTESNDVSFPAGNNVFLFSYFTGNGEDGLHLAYSLDGLSWKPLNNGESLLTPMVGKDRLMRDPS
ncbi:MAG: glycoside hydrolase family 28 protein, partial [Candidatus Cloacimonetes bacterium]|nr:glycoside hydrolase family 28 protein [Candidatus Cloacimonadota bacterium]